MEATQIATTVVWGGIVLGTVFGLVANRCNFCTMCAVSDIVNMGDWGRMRSWLLAIGVGILGTNLLAYWGLLDLGKTAYTGAVLPWFAYIVGGACFGIGMTLASGCGNKTMVRIGSGNLKSLVVLVFFGLSAMMTMKGVLGVFRLQVLQAPMFVVKLEPGQSLPAVLAAASGMDLKTLQLGCACAAALLIALFVFRDADFRQHFDNKLAGILIGLVVTAGWYVTGHLGLAENPDTLEMTYFGTNSHMAESMSFTGPTGYFLELICYWSDTGKAVSFGIATLTGVAIGSFIYAMKSHSFRLEHFSTADDMLRHIAGAVLMGFGGVTATGCSIGQGLTGVSTLSIGSYLALASIIAGAAVTMRVQYNMMMREA